jgi:O-antigen ligase
MNIILIILIAFMIGKDINYLSDPFTLRGAAQGLCLFVGLFWVVANFTASVIQKYWPVWLYLGVLFLTLFTAEDKLAVAFQIGSLVAVIVFFIAYYESRFYSAQQRQQASIDNKPLINVAVICYGLIAFASVAIYKLDPGKANEVLFIGETRFRGIFPKSAALGCAMGLLIGIAWFGWGRWWLKMIPIFAGLIALGLTLSRTFWFALFISVLITTWLYQPEKRKWLFVIACIGASFFLVFKTLDLTVRNSDINAATRAGSLEKLSGRTVLWDMGFKQLKNSPILGYGFTEGANVVSKEWNKIRYYEGRNTTEKDKARDTMHSGYIQAFMDSGYLGGFFYILVIFLAIKNLLAWDIAKQYPVEMFTLIFLTISNFGESIIYSAGVFTSIMFWAVAIFVFSLSPANRRQEPLVNHAHA